MKIRIIIAGSRNFTNFEFLEKECRRVFRELSKDGVLVNSKLLDAPNITIVSGGAIGTDRMAEEFASKYNIKTKIFLAEWKKHGIGAGYIRNGMMANYALEVGLENCFLIAFWDGSSKGTRHMINTAMGNRIKTFKIDV